MSIQPVPPTRPPTAGQPAAPPERWRPRLPRLPSLCAVCRGWGAERVCASCIARFAAPVPRCTRCALALPSSAAEAPDALCGGCLVDPPPFERSLTAVDYGHPWDGLIQRYKFYAGLDLGGVLAGRVLAAHRRGGHSAPTLLLPVPASAARLRERGYNQAWELARRLARGLRCRADPQLLLRPHDRPHQLALAPEQRAANVRGCFAVEPLRRAELRGTRVTLVDDVMTTGATAAEAARALLQAGAAGVDVWTVARTPRPDRRLPAA